MVGIFVEGRLVLELDHKGVGEGARFDGAVGLFFAENALHFGALHQTFLMPGTAEAIFSMASSTLFFCSSVVPSL